DGDLGAVLPQPLEPVVLALVVVLDVHHHVHVVQQRPAPLAHALAARGLVPGLPQLLLHFVDDRGYQALVRGRRDDGAVGDHQPLGHVQDAHIGGFLVRGGQRGDPRHLDGVGGCCHVVFSPASAVVSGRLPVGWFPVDRSRGGPAASGPVGRATAGLGAEVRTVPSARAVCAGRYRLRLAMYCTTPSGTRYQTGRDRDARSRHSVEDIANAGTSTTLTVSAGRPRSFSSRRPTSRSYPGRVTPTNLASSNNSSQRCQVRMVEIASAPVMKYRSASGCCARRSRRVSAV